MNQKPATIIEDKPIIKKYIELSKDEKEAVDILKSKFGMSEQTALETFFDQEKWMEWKSVQQRKLDIKDLEMATRLQDEVDTKIRSGSLGQVKEGFISLGVIRDKVLNQQAKGPTFMVAGKSITIKTSFPFKPYSKTWDEEKLKELKTIEGDEDGSR